MSLALKFGADFEKMITPDLSVNLGLTYKIAFAPSAASMTWDDAEPITYTELENPLIWESLGYSDISLGGISFSLGVNYALGELPINLFGFLDPFKKH